MFKKFSLWFKDLAIWFKDFLSWLNYWAIESPNDSKKKAPKRPKMPPSPLSINQLRFVQEEIAELDEVKQQIETESQPKADRKDFTKNIGYALSLGLKEKEIFFFALMQWLCIGLAYLLWVQMLGWIPDEVWEAAAEDESGAVGFIPGIILILWSFICVGVVSFPIGILSSCMGVAHFLTKQGRPSTVAACLKISLPNSWSLWLYHWADGWITVKQILERLPKDNDEGVFFKIRRWRRLVKTEALYYAWKVGSAGVLPSIITGNNLIKSGQESIYFVKDNFKEIGKLRLAYSSICWIVGIGAYVGTFLILTFLDEFDVFKAYLLACIPIVASLLIVILILRPIYVITICNLYSDYLISKGRTADLPENPSASVSALVFFAGLCLAIFVVYYFRVQLGLMDLLSTV